MPPSAMPGGTSTSISREIVRVPEPAHVGQGFAMTLPRPRHRVQGREKANMPWFEAAVPVPPQAEQGSAREPGAAPEPLHVAQVSVRGTLITVLPPRAAVSKGTETS